MASKSLSRLSQSTTDMLFSRLLRSALRGFLNKTSQITKECPALKTGYKALLLRAHNSINVQAHL